jgi:predicted Zn-dependent protease
MLQLPLRRVALCAVLLALTWTVAASSATARRPGKGKVLALVPIGASVERVAALDEIFRTELKLETAILPAIEPDAAGVDKRRKQLVAEKLVDQIRTEHRHLVSTGKVVVIGVTDQDMLLRAAPKRAFAFSHRDSSSSIAVVSTFRMDPRNLGTGINDAVLESRLRKMVAKNIGMLLYGLPASNDPHSLLFGGIDDVGEIDFIDERFASSGLLPAQ